MPGLPHAQATGCRLKACGVEEEREDVSRGKNGEKEWIAVEGKKIKERKKKKGKERKREREMEKINELFVFINCDL
jgi:hypothetical protein